MAFILAKMDVGLTPPIEHKPVTESESIALGEALVLSGGKLTKCGATSRPTFVAVGNKVTLHTDGLQVTATTTSGVATITYIAGQTVGSLVRVRF